MSCEAEEGCGGRVLQPYVLKKYMISNKELYMNLQGSSGRRKRRGVRLTISHYEEFRQKRDIFT